MSKTNSVATKSEKIEPVPETVEPMKEEEIVPETAETVEEKNVDLVEKPIMAAVTKVEKPGPIISFSAETQRMNARQFFDTYPHDNTQVVNLIITLYGTQIKTVAQWEAFYQSMLKKKVS